jgi:nitrogen fixation/metabolism regulation signal transduction histidine kinase
MNAPSGRIWRRLALAILVTALIPVGVAIWLAEIAVRQTSARFFVPEIGARLDRSRALYEELAHEVKTRMRAEADALSRDPKLRAAVEARDAAAMTRELRRLLGRYPSLVSLSVRDGDRVLASVDRGRPLDPKRENRLEVARGFGAEEEPGPERSLPRAEELDGAEPPPNSDRESPSELELSAVFAAEKARFEELSDASQFLENYRRIERRRADDEKSYLLAFALLLGITIVAAVGVGTLLARGVSRRVARLERATRAVAEGDLSVRVPVTGNDELGELARAFNRMVAEVETSRSRIEYLQRISAWQEMARRLAHEIKNPLTPIQLAVQDIHRRYSGSEPEFRKLLDTTLEVVEDEVGTLRRLVSEFSDFARLPQAELESADLGEFIREISERPLLLEADADGGGAMPAATIEFDVPKQPFPVLLDRQMLRRVLVNLVRNAAQAAGDKRDRPPRIVVRLAREGAYYHRDVEDDGPGIPKELREAVFDPYVTTKTAGTGLGLAIVKKIIVEHRGTISASESKLGGARLRVRLPAA